MRSQKWEYVLCSSAGLHLLSEIKISCKSSWVLNQGWRCCLLCSFAGCCYHRSHTVFSVLWGGWEVRVPAPVLSVWHHFVSILGLAGTDPPVLAIKAHLVVRGHPFIYGEKKNRERKKGGNLQIFISSIARKNPSSFCFQFRWSFNLSKFKKRKLLTLNYFILGLNKTKKCSLTPVKILLMSWFLCGCLIIWCPSFAWSLHPCAGGCWGIKWKTGGADREQGTPGLRNTSFIKLWCYILWSLSFISLHVFHQGQLESLLFFSLSLLDKHPYIQLGWKKKSEVICLYKLFEVCTTPWVLVTVYQKCTLPGLQSDHVTGRS